MDLNSDSSKNVRIKYVRTLCNFGQNRGLVFDVFDKLDCFNNQIHK